jgi:hypothetical protein
LSHCQQSFRFKKGDRGPLFKTSHASGPVSSGRDLRWLFIACKNAGVGAVTMTVVWGFSRKYWRIRSKNGGEAACRVGCRLSDALSPVQASVADRQYERGIGETTFRTFAKAEGLELDAASFVLHPPVSKSRPRQWEPDVTAGPRKACNII